MSRQIRTPVLLYDELSRRRRRQHREEVAVEHDADDDADDADDDEKDYSEGASYSYSYNDNNDEGYGENDNDYVEEIEDDYVVADYDGMRNDSYGEEEDEYAAIHAAWCGYNDFESYDAFETKFGPLKRFALTTHTGKYDTEI